MKQTNLRAHLRHLCCLGLPSETLMPQLLPLVRELVPADSAGFFWVDAVGHMQNLLAERMLTAPKMRLYFEHFYAGGKYDFQKNFVRRAQSGVSVAMSESDAAFRESAYYNEILKDLDAHHVLYGIVRDHGLALGQLSLYRDKQALAFSERDAETLSSLMHYITHAVAAPPSASASATEYIDSSDDAVLLVDAHGAVQHASEEGLRLVVQAVGGTFARGFPGSDSAEVTAILATVVGNLQRGEIPQITRETKWGRIQLRAYNVGDPGAGAATPIAVRITRQEPMILKFARSLQSINLPPQQQEVAMFLARGIHNHEIAKHMNVSVNTVAYHIKQLFARLEAHGRAELIERVVNQPS